MANSFDKVYIDYVSQYENIYADALWSTQDKKNCGKSNKREYT